MCAAILNHLITEISNNAELCKIADGGMPKIDPNDLKYNPIFEAAKKDGAKSTLADYVTLNDKVAENLSTRLATYDQQAQARSSMIKGVVDMCTDMWQATFRQYGQALSKTVAG